MTEQEAPGENSGSDDNDALVDAVCAVAIVVIPVLAVVYWLSGLPTS